MPPSAHTALVVSIVASTLGALVMCLLVARYGLTPVAGETTERGLLVTRLGHALAGVCFAVTGVLTLIMLVTPTREPRPASATVVKMEPDRAAEARVQALAAEVKAITTRLEQAEARMTAVDGAARRLGDEVGSMSARAKQLERTIAALPRRAEPPAKEARPAPAVIEPAPTPNPAPVSPLPPASPHSPEPVTAPRPAAPEQVLTPRPPAPEPTVAPRPPAAEPVVAPRPRAPEPVAHRPLPTAARAPEPVPSPRVVPPSGRATVEAPARAGDGGAAMAKPQEPQLADKLREDWKTIRGGLSTAGDDFKAAVRDLGRKLWR
ncbi:MAG TPA: hypothetical protein VIE36_10640 [Methylomirabilota bacterium]|jgi:hypothetical protein